MPRIKCTKKGRRHCLYYVPFTQHDDSSENYGADLHFQTIRAEGGYVLQPTQINSTNSQPSLCCQSDLKLSHDSSTEFQQGETCSSTSANLQTQNCFNDTKEPLSNAVDLGQSEDVEANNLLMFKSEFCSDDSDCKEIQNSSVDCKHDENNPSDSNEAQSCDTSFQLGKELPIQNESCDINSDPSSIPESSRETESLSQTATSLNEICGRETNCSSSSAVMADNTSAKSDAENCAELSPNQDLKRSRRNSKRKRDEDQCPVCGLTVRYADLENHYHKEVQNLSNISRNLRRLRSSDEQREGFRCGINLAFFQAKDNREKRITAHKEKYVKRHVVFCPVCKIRLSGSDEEINDHVLSCFGEDDDESDINVTEYDGSFEEYEIGNETRIRAISLVPGGHSALHGSSSKSRPAEEDDGDLNVDVDDTQAFGKPQYTELDVIHNINMSPSKTKIECKKEEQLRRAVVYDPTAEPQVIEGKKWSQNCQIQNEIDEINNSCSKNKPKDAEPGEDEGESSDVKKDEENVQVKESGIISSLKERVKDLEDQKNVKCLICLEPYTRPVVSTTCWHVYCEECWLVSMGVKKLCPQCNMIVCPTDLRRIYL